MSDQLAKYTNQLFNQDCIRGCEKHIPDKSIDLIITDPPYGINGDKLHKHYNRNEIFVLNGYTEIPIEEYPSFSLKWIKQAERILKPGGSIYIVSGYTNLIHILNALSQTELVELNHLIWKYNFGVYTKNKYVSSHYHILYYVKKGKKHTFNTNCRFGADERDSDNGSQNYKDREDVWIINREYKPGKVKNKNELPRKLLTKLIQYSSNEGDMVCDLFLGGFSTVNVAYGLNRNVCGFEVNETSFNHHFEEFKLIKKGSLLQTLRQPKQPLLFNQGEPWHDDDLNKLAYRYRELMDAHCTKMKAIELLSQEFGRGRFALTNALKKIEG